MKKVSRPASPESLNSVHIKIQKWDISYKLNVFKVHLKSHKGPLSNHACLFLAYKEIK